MAPKKKPDPDVSHIEVECEIAELAGESRTPTSSKDHDWNAARSMFTDFLKEQDLRNNQLLTSLSQTVAQSNQALIAALKAPVDPQPSQACPSQSPRDHTDLFTPSQACGNVEIDWDEMEDPSSDDGDAFDGFEYPSPSGKTTLPSKLAAPPVPDPSQPSTSGTQEATGTQNQILDEELFNIYGLEANWQLAPELIAWIQSICNREIPVEVLKTLNEEFVPKDELQPIFVAPALPTAINRKLYTAPKSQSRVPKLVNSFLLRAQKELCISYKPFIEVLNFFYSEAFLFLTESIPEIREEMARLKHLLSQGLAVLMSAGLKISKARKQSLRPLFNYKSTSILDQAPTSAHVLGSDDLATISDKASKERKALSGVFRMAQHNRGRFRNGYKFRSFRGYRQYNYQPQPREGYKKSFKSRPKSRSRSRPNKTSDN